MNNLIQNILVLVAVSLAVMFMVKKFFWKKPSKSKKSCGGSDDCGCH